MSSRQVNADMPLQQITWVLGAPFTHMFCTSGSLQDGPCRLFGHEVPRLACAGQLPHLRALPLVLHGSSPTCLLRPFCRPHRSASAVSTLFRGCHKSCCFNITSSWRLQVVMDFQFHLWPVIAATRAPDNHLGNLSLASAVAPGQQKGHPHPTLVCCCRSSGRLPLEVFGQQENPPFTLCSCRHLQVFPWLPSLMC